MIWVKPSTARNHAQHLQQELNPFSINSSAVVLDVVARLARVIVSGIAGGSSWVITG